MWPLVFYGLDRTITKYKGQLPVKLKIDDNSRGIGQLLNIGPLNLK